MTAKTGRVTDGGEDGRVTDDGEDNDSTGPTTATDGAGGEGELLTVYRRCELFESSPVITGKFVYQVACYYR